MRFQLQVPERGEFLVADDPQNVLATALAVVTSPDTAHFRHRALAPGGGGYDVEDVGWIRRIDSGHEPADDAPGDTWALTLLPDAQLVLGGTELRALVERALALRLAFPRVVSMDPWGNFTVTDDVRNAIGTALVVATAPQHADVVDAALQPGGSGLGVTRIGAICPVRPGRLGYPFSEDLTLDPSTQELWYVFRDGDGADENPSEVVITGDELRALVRQARALRVGFRPAPLK